MDNQISATYSKSFWQKYYVEVFAAVLVILGSILRFNSIGWDNLERDEAQVLGIASDPNLINVINLVAGDGNPPLIHLIFWPYVQLFGLSILPEKTLAWLISSSLPLVSFLLLRNSLGRTIALISCLLLAFSPPLIRYGEMIRCYGLLHICTIWSTLLLFDFWQQNKRRPTVKYAAVIAASLYLHLSFLAVIVAHIGFAVKELLSRDDAKKHFYSWFKSSLMAAIAFLPWAFVVRWVMSRNQIPWFPDFDAPTLFVMVLGYLFENLSLFALFHSLGNLLFCLCVLLSLKQKNLGNVFYLFIGSLLGFYLLLCCHMPFRDRYLSVVLPLALVLVATAVQNLLTISASASKRILFSLLALLTISIMMITWAPLTDNLMATPENQFAAVAEDFLPFIDPRKDLVVVGVGQACPEVCRIIPQTIKLASFPELGRVKSIEWNGYSERTRDLNNLNKLYDTMNDCIQAKGSVWLVSIEPNLTDLEKPENLLNHYAIEQKRAYQIQTWLSEHAQEKRRIFRHAQEYDAMGFQFAPKSVARETTPQ